MLQLRTTQRPPQCFKAVLRVDGGLAFGGLLVHGFDSELVVDVEDRFEVALHGRPLLPGGGGEKAGG